MWPLTSLTKTQRSNCQAQTNFFSLSKHKQRRAFWNIYAPKRPPLIDFCTLAVGPSSRRSGPQCWIKAQIDSGHYTNDSEIIRDLIRREQERAAEIDAIRVPLLEGENSGVAVAFSATAFKKRTRVTHG